MSQTLDGTIEILEHLVGFPTVSGRPNGDIVGYCRDYLEGHGIGSSLSYDEKGERANLFATIGPEIDGGVVLSGHTDVVPVEGQAWSNDPFTLTRQDDRLYGRGSVDMKGFLACVLGSVPAFKAMDLKRPIHIAFSFDEETGSFGMPYLLKDMAGKPYRPAIVIVGEPTEMKIVSGHKGAFEMRTEITGFEVHSSNPTRGVSAITYGMRLISKIDEMARAFASNPYIGSPYDPPYATFNVGKITGGAVRNATAGWCHFDWELRPMPGEDGAAVIAEIEAYAMEELLPEMRAAHSKADIKVITEAPVPPLDDKNAGEAVAFICEITGINAEDVVSFGTDGGFFSEKGYPTVVFGPGSIDRAHQPDEYVRVPELAEGLDFLKKVGERLTR